jgi:hypothetical protein
LRAEGFFCSLDVISGGLGIGKLQFLITKLSAFSTVNFFSNFGHQNPGSGLGPDWIQIRNTGKLKSIICRKLQLTLNENLKATEPLNPVISSPLRGKPHKSFFRSTSKLRHLLINSLQTSFNQKRANYAGKNAV